MIWIISENGDIKQKGADGRGEAISLVKFSPDGKFLAVGSHDNNIYIYQWVKTLPLSFDFILNFSVYQDIAVQAGFMDIQGTWQSLIGIC